MTLPWAEDDGESERRPVTGRIGVEHERLCKKALCDITPAERRPTSVWCTMERKPKEGMQTIQASGKHIDANAAHLFQMCGQRKGNASTPGISSGPMERVEAR